MNAMRDSWLLLLSVPGAVQVLLAALKLAKVIGWPWWLVLAPLWVTLIAAAGFAAIFLTALGSWGR